MGSIPNHVTLIGAGQVGRALARALPACGIPYRLHAWRRGLPSAICDTQLVLICVRDAQIPAVVAAMQAIQFGSQVVIAHVSGLLGSEVLDPLKPGCRAVGQLHPFCSIRSIGHVRNFAGTYFLGAGDRAAIPMLRRVVRALGGKFVRGDAVDRQRYHLAAALMANGSIALMHAASRLLKEAGIEQAVGTSMLCSLQQSVLYNTERLGLATALTGPVRRGDIETLRKHLAVLGQTDRTTLELYRTLLRIQIQIVKELAELDRSTLRRLQRVLSQ